MFGPVSSGRLIGLVKYRNQMLSPKDGAHAYFGGYLAGSEGKPRLVPTEVRTDGGSGSISQHNLSHGIILTLIPVYHIDVPAFGVTIEVAGKRSSSALIRAALAPISWSVPKR
jgi:hypothetical protein